MDLHYSQTTAETGKGGRSVSLPYEFTLFSNHYVYVGGLDKVSLPYEFTLFSNYVYGKGQTLLVSLPYGFTLFSNLK